MAVAQDIHPGSFHFGHFGHFGHDTGEVEKPLTEEELQAKLLEAENASVSLTLLGTLVNAGKP